MSKRQFRIEVFKGVFSSAFYDDEEKETQLEQLFNQDVQYDKLRELSSGDGGRGGLTKNLLLLKLPTCDTAKNVIEISALKAKTA